MHAVEAADHVAVHHVHHRLGDAVVDALEGVHPFLHDDFGHFQPFLHHRHLVARLAVEAAHLVAALHAHDAHAVGAGVGLHDHVRLVADAVFAVLDADFFQHLFHQLGQLVLALARLEVEALGGEEVGVDQPRVDRQHLREVGDHLVVGGKVVGLAPHRPAGVQRRQQVLFDVLQDVGQAGGEVVVEQHDAGAEAVGQHHAVAAPLQRLDGDDVAIGGSQLRRFGDFRIQRA
ncbi:hypothetical protein D3C85_1169940 [compost metagenome]